jgi:hypothetical protein
VVQAPAQLVSAVGQTQLRPLHAPPVGQATQAPLQLV